MSRSFSSGFRHRLARSTAVVGLAATVVFVGAPAMVSAATVPLAGSTFSISGPGSLSGTSGQPITPVQFVASNVDASTAPATTSIKWVAGQLPAGLALSATGVLSGTLNASIPDGVYDLRVIATEKVTYKSRRNQSTTYLTTDLATHISISGPSVSSSNQTVIASGFSYPYGVAVDGSGHVFVADTFNNRIVEVIAGFSIPDQTIPTVQAGQPLAATQLVAALVDPSTPPKVTSVKWFASSLPAGLRLSSSGVLSGTPNAALDAGTYSIYVTATEKVTTKVGKVTTLTTKPTSREFQIVIT